MSFQVEMAVYTVFSREQLEQCLRLMDEDFEPSESDFNLACRIDTSQSIKRPNLIQVRQEHIAQNLRYALMPSPEDKTQRNLDIYPLEILKQMAIDLNFFPETILQAFLWNNFGVHLVDKDWDTLSARIQEEDPKVNPVEVLRREISSQARFRLKQLQTLLAVLRQHVENQAKPPTGFSGYDPTIATKGSARPGTDGSGSGPTTGSGSGPTTGSGSGPTTGSGSGPTTASKGDGPSGEKKD